MLDELGEHGVESRSQLSSHHQVAEEPAYRTELYLILKGLGDACHAAIGLESRNPAHEMDRPVALRDFESYGAAFLPAGDAFHDPTFRHEIARASGTDAGP